MMDANCSNIKKTVIDFRNNLLLRVHWMTENSPVTQVFLIMICFSGNLGEWGLVVRYFRCSLEETKLVKFSPHKLTSHTIIFK